MNYPCIELMTRIEMPNGLVLRIWSDITSTPKEIVEGIYDDLLKALVDYVKLEDRSLWDIGNHMAGQKGVNAVEVTNKGQGIVVYPVWP